VQCPEKLIIHLQANTIKHSKQSEPEKERIEAPPQNRDESGQNADSNDRCP
jgi:hypothetical protein